MRYIDADVLEAVLAIRKHELMDEYGNLGGAASGALMLVQSQPTADVAPVEHAERIDINGDGSGFVCTNCNEQSCCNGDYCTHCGAKMGGKDGLTSCD